MTNPRSSILELKSLILNRTDDISHLSRCRLAVGVIPQCQMFHFLASESAVIMEMT